jgi:hypothetical protein
MGSDSLAGCRTASGRFRVDLLDHRHKLFVAEPAGRLRPLLAGEVRRRRQVQHPADGIGPETVRTQVVDHLLGLVRGRSISWAKNTEAAFKISLARLNSATSWRVASTRLARRW